MEAQISGKAGAGLMPGGAAGLAEAETPAASGGPPASRSSRAAGVQQGPASNPFGQPAGGDANAAAGAGAKTAIQVDPSKIPAVTDIAPKIFPATTAISVDKSGITIVTRESFPDVITTTAFGGVATGLLLPAVQAARAAARRAAGLPETPPGGVTTPPGAAGAPPVPSAGGATLPGKLNRPVGRPD